MPYPGKVIPKYQKTYLAYLKKLVNQTPGHSRSIFNACCALCNKVTRYVVAGKVDGERHLVHLCPACYRGVKLLPDSESQEPEEQESEGGSSNNEPGEPVKPI